MSFALATLGCTSRLDRVGDRADAGGTAGDSGLRGGQRLRPRFLVEQGADVDQGMFVGWHDDELDVDCRFVRDTDDAYRCLPIEWSGLRVYPDATCAAGTGVVAQLVHSDGAPVPDCTPRYASYLYEATGCDESSAGGVLRITGPSTASRATQRFVMSVFGACNPWDSPGSDPLPPECLPEEGCDPAAFDPGPQWVFCEYETVESSTFVAAETEVRVVGNLRQVVLHGEDGSLEPGALLHPELDVPLARDSWAGDRLVPQGTHWGELPAAYADEACSMPALCFPNEEPQSALDPVVSAPAECARAVLVDQDACSGKVYELGERIASPSFCGGSAVDPEQPPLACYEPARVLEPIPYEELAVEAGRLRPLWIAQEGKPVAPAGYFEDHELGTRCGPHESGGVVRCDPISVPSVVVGSGMDWGWQEYFADAACEQSLGFAYVPRCGEPTPSLGRLFPDLVRMLSVGAPDAAEIYTGFSPTPGFVLDCIPAVERPGELFEAEPLDPSALAKLEEVTR